MNKKRFSLKIFAGITCILLAVSLLVFGILRLFMPKIYEEELTAQIEVNSAAFANELETAPLTEWTNMLMQFCLLNNTSAAIFDENGNEIAVFAVSVFTADTEGNIAESEEDIFSNYSISVLSDDEKPYTIVFYINSEKVKQVTDTFEKMFPVLFVVIFIISLFIAFFYTRFLVRIKNLQIANEKLQTDIAEERRRRHFFSAISHELKTPVTILKGELDGMILGIGKFKDRDKYLGEAYKTTESIEKLVKDIMTAAKLDIVNINPEEINLSEITNECLAKIDELVTEKNIKIKQSFSETTVFADKMLIGIAISNIIGNAVKHSPQDSEIDINISEMSEFSVENHGTYINETSAETDLSGGLGLYIINSILDLHEFEYSFENIENGTKFTINFTKK